MLRTVASLTFASLSLFGCATQAGEEHELGDVLVDGAADSWSSPTRMGTLFEDTWQYGALLPQQSVRTPAWTFSLTGEANIEVTTRVAPLTEDDVSLTRSVVYLYKQRDAGTWQRIAKSEVGEGFGSVAKALGEGTYRVIVKGVEAEDVGDFMLRLGCTGDGCADGPQCLFPDSYEALTEQTRGAIQVSSRDPLTATSNIMQAAPLVIRAVQVSGANVSTLAEAFAAVDGGEINRDFVNDTIGGRSFRSYEYGAGDNSFGAIFLDFNPEPVAEIYDGEITNCKAFAKTCVLGQTTHETAYMPDMKQVAEHTFERASDASAYEAQIREAASSDGVTPTLAEAFESADDNTIYADEYRHTDGRTFVRIMYYAGDNSVGAYFAKGSVTRVADIGDDDVANCNAF